MDLISNNFAKLGKNLYIGLLDENFKEIDCFGYKRVAVERNFENWKVKKNTVINRNHIKFKPLYNNVIVYYIGIFDKKKHGNLLLWCRNESAKTNKKTAIIKPRKLKIKIS